MTYTAHCAPFRDIVDSEPSLGIEWTTAHLRELPAATPATGYTTWGER